MRIVVGHALLLHPFSNIITWNDFFQDLQQEIIRARMRMMEPFLKGPAGLEYLRKGFADRYGPPSDAHTSLPVTLQWLSSILTCKDYEWEEHKSSLSALVSQETSSGLPLPSTTLRTGGSFRVKTSGNQITSSHTSDVSNITGEDADINLVYISDFELLCHERLQLLF